jgi:protein-tyrosine phosphatase
VTDRPAILTVCTGNLCRSPVLERLLRFGLAQHWPEAVGSLQVASAGTHAVVGQTIPPPLMRRLAAVGVDSSPFVARQLTRDMVAEADLVIAMTRAHRAAVVELHPRSVRITFTLRELSRLTTVLPPGDRATRDPGTRLTSFVSAIAACRGLAPGAEPADDVIDPYRGRDARYQDAWTQLLDGSSALLDALVPPQLPAYAPAAVAAVPGRAG